MRSPFALRFGLTLALAGGMFLGGAAQAQIVDPYGSEPHPSPPAYPPPAYHYQPPAYPPPVYALPPQGYYAPPPAYAPPPTYVPPPLYAPPPQACPVAPTPQAAYCPSPQLRFHEVERRQYGLMTAGLIIFAASWSANAIGAYMSETGDLAIPIIGPIMVARDLDTSRDNVGNRMLQVGLVFDALIQTTGAVMFVAGLFSHHKVKVYDKVTIAPLISPDRFALAATARF